MKDISNAIEIETRGFLSNFYALERELSYLATVKCTTRLKALFRRWVRVPVTVAKQHPVRQVAQQ